MRISQRGFSKFLAISAFALAIHSSSLPVAAQSVPPELTLQPGTIISVRINDWLSSDQNRPGDGFSAVLAQPLVADGWVVAHRGQPVMGRVAVAQKAGRIKGVSQLGVELSELTMADGQVVPLHTQMVQSSAGTSKGTDAAVVAGTTGFGAAIGAIAGGGKGAGIGAGAGAAAGVIGVLATPGKPTVIPAETLLTFRVEYPLTISTARSQAAFQPVTAQSYEAAAPPPPVYRRQQYVAPPAPVYVAPPVYYPAYPVPRIYYYPAYPVYPYSYGYYYRPYRYNYYYPGTTFVFRFNGSHGYNHYGYRGNGHGHYGYRH